MKKQSKNPILPGFISTLFLNIAAVNIATGSLRETEKEWKERVTRKRDYIDNVKGYGWNEWSSKAFRELEMKECEKLRKK